MVGPRAAERQQVTARLEDAEGFGGPGGVHVCILRPSRPLTFGQLGSAQLQQVATLDHFRRHRPRMRFADAE